MLFHNIINLKLFVKKFKYENKIKKKKKKAKIKKSQNKKLF